MQQTARKEKLKSILDRLNQGEDIEKVKGEAKDFIAGISAKELSEAEQELVNEGLEESELRHLCTAHIEAMADELDQLKIKLPAGHPLETLIDEHTEILKFLEKLDELNNKFQNKLKEEITAQEIDELKEVAKNLIDTEKHHTREEETLFPLIEEKGITGPTRIMVMEHEDLWPRKEQLNELVDEFENLDFPVFKERLEELANYLVVTLRDHIYKENHILYPTAFEVIAEGKWSNIKKECDEIGYCSFTPNHK